MRVGDGSSSAWGVTVMAVDRGVIVHGDGCELICFSGYCRPIDTFEDARGAINWIGACRSWEYLIEKARLGTRSDLHENDLESALDHVRGILNMSEEELNDEHYDLDLVSQAMDEFENEDFTAARATLARCQSDAWEWAGLVGRVPQTRFFRGWGAVNRLNTLLSETGI